MFGNGSQKNKTYEPVFAVSQNDNLKGNSQQDRYLIDSFTPTGRLVAEGFLSEVFQKMVQATSGEEHVACGSTAAIATVLSNGDVVTAHLGDSQVCAFIYDPKEKNKSEYLLLTPAHTPSIELTQHQKGDQSWVELNGRIGGGGPAVNRSLGDHRWGYSISKEPQIAFHNLSKHLTSGKEVYLLIFSDGALSEKRGITLDKHFKPFFDARCQKPAKEGLTKADMTSLVKSIADTGATYSYDDTTIGLIRVDGKNPAIAAVFDGHGGEKTAEVAVQTLQEELSQFK